MDRRLLLTFLFATVFALLYMKVFAPPPAPPVVPPVSGTPAAPATGTDPATTPSSRPAATAPATVPDKFPATRVGEKAVARFESDKLIVELTNRGAAITRIRLKEHYRNVGARLAKSTDENDLISLFPEQDRYRRALALREVLSAGGAERWRLDQVSWDVREEQADDGARVVVFSYSSPDGFEFEKRFTFRPGVHWIGLDFAVRCIDADNRLENLEYVVTAAGSFQDVPRGNYTDGPEASFEKIVQGEKQVTRQYHRDLNAPAQAEGVAASDAVAVAWSGCGNLYFCGLLAPQSHDLLDPTVARADSVWIARSDDQSEEGVQAWFQGRARLDHSPAAAERKFTRRSFKFYAGPKDQSVFEREGMPALTPLIEEDFGSWTSLRWINKLLLAGLRFFESFTHNWGVAIILLTVLVRIIVFPITRMQQVSMTRYSLKMSALKPKLDELKERFKNNPQKYAQEQMKLLREHGARPPLVGCLSSFITIPVFVGIFQILRFSIELRHAPFVGWVRDLSMPDALATIPGIGIDVNVLPILATAAFMAQMMMQPKPTDPQARQQQKIMLIMPLIFGVMFYGYASGLSLYMLVSSTWAIFESKVIRKYFFPVPGAPGGAVSAAVVPARK